MEDKDKENITFSHKVSSLSTEGGKKFLREKFTPKIDLIIERYKNDYFNRYILDVGVGYGAFLKFLEEKGFRNIFGMDPFVKSIAISKRYTGAVIRNARIEDKNWPFAINMFDVITSFDVVEHLRNPECFFINAKKYLKQNGIIIISTPNKQLPYLVRKLPYIGIPDNNPTHYCVKKPSFWMSLAENSGFRILKYWQGEHLTHLKIIPKLLKKICRFFNLDPQNVPVIRSFQQSFCMLLTPEP